ncbi:MAG: hypothetical protein Q8O14_12825 [bacterium]|nr:hypothetical protein [bacterium]
MATTVSQLIQVLRGELVAAAEADLTTEQLRNALRRGVVLMNRDFELAYVVEADQETITPTLTDLDLELLLLAATPTCCRIEIAKAARRPSFKAGAIEIDTTRAAGAWRELLSHAQGEYQRLVELSEGDRQAALKSLLFERGSVVSTDAASA